MSTIPAAMAPPVAAGTTSTAGAQWICALLGHEMDNRTLTGDGDHPRCRRCREPILHEDGRLTHTRHVLGCFLRHHTYVPSGVREGHNEYTCLRCGHPLLFETEHDPYSRAALFTKKVRYLCGLFGHDVHTVGERQGWTEYACGCGHSFLRSARGLSRVTHPLKCTLSGHRVAFVERRGAYREHRCLDCGHTFGVAAPVGAGESGARRRAAAASGGGFQRGSQPTSPLVAAVRTPTVRCVSAPPEIR